MAHGLPDWGQIPDVAGYVLTDDLAELAARLGSICVFDRRGSVFFLDDFERGVEKWKLTGSSNEETFEMFSGYAQAGGYCGRLQTGDTDGNEAQIQRHFPFPKLVKLGFEIGFTLDSKVSELRWGFYAPAISKYLMAEIFYNVETEEIFYCDGNGARIGFASDLDLQEADYCFHTMKLVIDLTTNKYVRFILNNVEYDLSEYAYYVGDTPTKLYMYAYMNLTTGEDSQATSYVDNAIITRDEP